MTRLGVVLAGGAARGAYQAGVLRYLFTELPKHLGRVPWPEVVTGCSVGALNGVFVGARDVDAVERMCEMWRSLSIDKVYQLHGNSVFRALRRMVYPVGGASVLDASPLVKLVSREMPTRALRAAIDAGETHAFVVSATSLQSGFNVLFTDSADAGLDLDPLPGTRVIRTRMKPKHLLASCALPLLFPPIGIQGDLYVDGGLRQNTPLRPCIHSGVQKVLVLGVHLSQGEESAGPTAEVVPSLPFLAGKSLNALMLDPIWRDIQRAEKINEIVAWGVERYGPQFAAHIDAELGLKQVEVHYLRPSVDLGRVAASRWQTAPPKVSGQLGWMLSAIADRVNAAGGESDLLSYLFFDQGYTAEIEALGFEDAGRHAESLAAFLLEPSE